MLDTASTLDASLYEGLLHSEREEVRKRLTSYGKIGYPKEPLGYGGVGGLIVMPYNTPNSTLPILWSDSNKWLPLFRRVRRISGIGSFKYKLEEAAKARIETPRSEKIDRTCTIFVERKHDEAFFDTLNEVADLKTRLNVPDVKVVSVGILHNENVIRMLAETTSNPIVVVDDDGNRAQKMFAKNQEHIPHVNLFPSFFKMFDIERVLEELPEIANSIPDEIRNDSTKLLKS
ncbi:hypothetical protein ACE04B_07065, partial [Rhizobium phaseoli]